MEIRLDERKLFTWIFVVYFFGPQDSGMEKNFCVGHLALDLTGLLGRSQQMMYLIYLRLLKLNIKRFFSGFQLATFFEIS